MPSFKKIPENWFSGAGKITIGGADYDGTHLASMLRAIHDDITALEYLTPDDGFATEIINKTGSLSVKGTVVSASTVNENSFVVASADSQQPMGIVYDDGIADGELCRIISAGKAQVLIKDGTTATKGNWVKVSDDTAGRADATNASPPGGTIGALEDHMSEIGHCLEDKGSGTNVLAWCLLHLN